MESRKPSTRALAIAACALVAVGLGRGLYQHTAVDRNTYVPPIIDDRYRELVRALPAQGDLFYLTDAPGSAQHMQAIYALAPHRLIDQRAPAAPGVADMMDKAHLADLCARAGVRPVRFFHGGDVALLEAAR